MLADSYFLHFNPTNALSIRKPSNAEKESKVFMEDPNSCLISANIDVLSTDLAYQFTKLHFDVFGQLHQKIYAAGLVFFILEILEV
ncbi:hypothetical protein LWI29_036737 [Acer saccharum]|uniref:Uncharacterized protein n=1 Tax=Acer saccharum TaxID=4024 RepID=A0AA39VU24_ACESA|nr:hypothetical protein LWI29_036737 [Acer saccharum]